MGLTLRPDRVGVVSPGIPGARSQPSFGQQAEIFRGFANLGRSRSRRRAARALSCQLLNGLLADSMALYEHYNKYDWQSKDDDSSKLYTTLDEQAREHRELIDLLVERVRQLGGNASVPRQVANLTVITRPPNGTEEFAAAVSRLTYANQLLLGRIRAAVAIVANNPTRDEGTESLLRSMLRRYESLVWSLEDLSDAAAMCA
jgi:starvation-inducible DNA-binding protein